MVDTHTPGQRSENMRRIRGKDTVPELAVRRLVRRLHYSYRLKKPGLPGRPDLIFPKLKKIIYVHGCFWHQHTGCPATRVPKSRLGYWLPKLKRNMDRDVEYQNQLGSLGWSVLVVWACEV